MSPRSFAPLLLGALLLGCVFTSSTQPVAMSAEVDTSAAFDPAKRIPWTTSHIVGSPDPPLPYRVARALPKLTVKQPITVVPETGTGNLLLARQRWPWVGPGQILRVKDDGAGDQSEVLLDLDRTIYGVALHPDYENNGFLYLGSNGPITSEDKDIPGRRFRPGAAKTTRISRFTVSRKPPFGCDPRTEQIVVDWPSNGHNGGDLDFGPDGMLYISAGDGTSDSDINLAGQDLTRLLAKVLRIDVDHAEPGRPYRIPRDNPFRSVQGARPETWAYGFRNPWRLHVDRVSGDLWVGNNGQDLWEQIYLVRRGANYGWSLYEGSHPFYPNRKQGPTPISKPIAEHHHSEARSLTGGLVYRRSALPELRGTYLYGDWSTGKIWGLRHKQGKVVFHRELADTALQVAGFGSDSQGELLIVDYGGGLYRLQPAPAPAEPASPFPKRLSETGLFTSVADHRTQPALIPYTVNSPLWSDGARKDRFIALPGLSKIGFRLNRGWDFPEGAVLVKTFSLERTAGDPTSRRRIETRLLTRQQGEWQGYSYLWNDEQTDATLVPAAGEDHKLIIRDASTADGRYEQTWHFPSRAECMVCHSRAANFVLGLNTLQMNRDYHYGGHSGETTENQLRLLERLGILRVGWLDYWQVLKSRSIDLAGQRMPSRLRPALQIMSDNVPSLAALRVALPVASEAIEQELRERPRYVATLPRRPRQLPKLVDPYDAGESLDRRARSYLHANCAICHVTAGGGNSQIDLEFTTARSKMRLFGVRPRHKNFGIRDARLIAPQNPGASILLQRLALRGTGQMPPLATSRIDQKAVRLFRAWITQMDAGAVTED